MHGSSQWVMSDSFFGSLSEDGDWQRCTSDRDFAQQETNSVGLACTGKPWLPNLPMHWVCDRTGTACDWWWQMY